MIKYAIKKLKQVQKELSAMEYFRTVIKCYKEDFKRCYKALNPLDKFRVYTFIARRDKELAKEICEIMTKKKTLSFEIGG